MQERQIRRNIIKIQKLRRLYLDRYKSSSIKTSINPEYD